MAYIKPLTDEEEKRLAAGEPLLSQGGSQIIGGQGEAGTGAPMLSPQKSGTSGFTDISAYLEANKPQTQQLAQKFAGQMGTQAETTRGLVGGVGKEFQRQVGAGTTNLDAGMLKSATENPVEFAQTPENVAKLTALRDAQYVGPESIENIEPYKAARESVTEAERLAKLPETNIGRREMLYKEQKNPTRGTVTLDEALLGQSPEAVETMKQGAAQFGGLSDYLTQQGTEGQTAVEAAKKATSEASGAVKTGLSEAEKKIQEDIDKRTAEARAKAGGRVAAMTPSLQNIGTQALTDEQLADLGITKEQYRNLLYAPQTMASYRSPSGTIMTPEGARLQQDIYNAVKPENVDLTKYFSQTQTPEVGITKENIANPEEYAKYLALSGLAGEAPSYLTPTTQEQAGTANLDLSQFDFGAAQKAGAGAASSADLAFVKYLQSLQNQGAPGGTLMGRTYVPSPDTYQGSAEDKAKLMALGQMALERLPQQPGISYTDQATGIDYGAGLGNIPGTPASDVGSAPITPPQTQPVGTPPPTGTPYNPPNMIDNIQAANPTWKYLGNNNWQTDKGTVHISG